METWTITRQRERHTAVGLTAAKLERVEHLSREWQRLVRELVHELWSPASIADVVPAKGAYSIQKRRRADGSMSRSPLNSHYQDTAIVRACAIVRAGWEQTFAAIRRKAARLPENERHEINWLLRWPSHLATIVAGGAVIPDVAKLAANDHERIQRRLCQWLMDLRPSQPNLRFRPQSELSDGHYRSFIRRGRPWLSIASLEKGRPIRLPMAGTDLEYLDGTVNLNCSIERDVRGRQRVVFRVATRAEVAAQIGLTAGADKGITNVLTLTTGDHKQAISYGTDYGRRLTQASNANVRRNRGRLRALARSRRNSARITKHNLGTVKLERQTRRARAALRQAHNAAIRSALTEQPVAVLAVEDLSFTRTSNRGKTVNRRLARWSKGQLHRDLIRLSEAHGVRLQVVNAAYSSQACPRCFWTDRSNRCGQAFRCSRCGLAGLADAVAASNLRSRLSDPEIARYTPHQSVKQILLQRAAERSAGSAPGEQALAGRSPDDLLRPVSAVPLATDSRLLTQPCEVA